MRELSHPNLVKLYEVIDDRETGKLLMVVEYCEGGPLVKPGQLTPERRMPEAIALFYFRQMAAGLAHLHLNGVVHGDIKPENMLLSGDSSVKIADFGQSQFMKHGDDTLHQTLGTPAFLAPEICEGGQYQGRAADIWALGVSLYSFVYGQMPFQGNNLLDLYENIANAEIVFPGDVALSMELQDVLLRMMCKDPESRITADQLVQHAWVREDDMLTLVPSVCFDTISDDEQLQSVIEESLLGGSSGYSTSELALLNASNTLQSSNDKVSSTGKEEGGSGINIGGGSGREKVSSSLHTVTTPMSVDTDLQSSSKRWKQATLQAREVAAAVFPSLYIPRAISEKFRNASSSERMGTGESLIGAKASGPTEEDDKGLSLVSAIMRSHIGRGNFPWVGNGRRDLHGLHRDSMVVRGDLSKKRLGLSDVDESDVSESDLGSQSTSRNHSRQVSQGSDFLVPERISTTTQTSPSQEFQCVDRTNVDDRKEATVNETSPGANRVKTTSERMSEDTTKSVVPGSVEVAPAKHSTGLDEAARVRFLEPIRELNKESMPASKTKSSTSDSMEREQQSSGVLKSPFASDFDQHVVSDVPQDGSDEGAVVRSTVGETKDESSHEMHPRYIDTSSSQVPKQKKEDRSSSAEEERRESRRRGILNRISIHSLRKSRSKNAFDDSEKTVSGSSKNKTDTSSVSSKEKRIPGSDQQGEPQIQWQQYRAGQRLDEFEGNSLQKAVYYVESGVVELRWEAALPVKITSVFSAAFNTASAETDAKNGTQVLSQSRIEAEARNSSGTSPKDSGSSDAHRLQNLDSIALTATRVADLSKMLQNSTKDRVQDNEGRGTSEDKQDSSQTYEKEKVDGMAMTLQRAVWRAETLMANAAGGSLDNLLISERCAGQYLGALSMLDPNYFADRWKQSAIAASDCIVIRMTREGLDLFLSQNPLAQVYLRASMARGRAEIVKLEVLERIADVQRHQENIRKGKRRISWKSAIKDYVGVPLGDAIEALSGQIPEDVASRPSAEEKPTKSQQQNVVQRIAAPLDMFALVGAMREAMKPDSIISKH